MKKHICITLSVVLIALLLPMRGTSAQTPAGTCLEFLAGDSSFVQTAVVFPPPDNEVTVMAWVLMEETNGDVDQGIVFHPSSFLLELEGSKNWSIDFTITPYESSELSPDDETVLGEWVHYTGVFDGAMIALYKNGEWMGEMQATVEMGQDSGAYEIGRSIWGSAHRHFLGCIDEVSIWELALDEQTIAEWYNKQVTKEHPYYNFLVGYWQFNEGQGDIAKDSGPRGLDGTLINCTSSNWIESDAPILATKVERAPRTPAVFKLQQNYPNPFNPSTTLFFELAAPSKVSLHIYNVNGELVETLLDEQRTPGVHQVVWDATSYPAGIYIAALRTPEHTKHVKMSLLK